jgi:hypothetical protein
LDHAHRPQTELLHSYIQGINSEGGFYGTVHHFSGTGGSFSNAVGQLTAQELATIVDLVNQIRSRPKPSPSTTSEYIGVLGNGPPSHAATSPNAIIFRAFTDNIQSPSGVDFMRITQIIESHIPPASTENNP